MNTRKHDLSACRELIRHGSHSFFMASLLLPRQTAIPATALYAFCRIADDLIDAEHAGKAAIESLHQRLDAIYAGDPLDHPEDRALAEVVSLFAIPRSMPDALIEGLAWDAAGRDYETLSELYDYAARVAGCVGAMMSLIMRTSDARAVARACDLGVAMQLTNIARDIGEDARMGRLYLPRSWFKEAGLDPEQWLQNPVQNKHISTMCKRLLTYANMLYQRADAGVALLPLSCRAGIRAARMIYSDIGRQIALQDYETVSQRAVVPLTRKSLLLAGSALSIPLRFNDQHRDQLEWPPLLETSYLIEDVESVPHVPRVEWLLNLFQSLEDRPRRISHSKL
ncbi:MAG: phytoene/squalene synthase family protein [Granulosicoccus sp.]|nr:phytoene/squalene synthase family protein [Granulosicoccus sp.]